MSQLSDVFNQVVKAANHSGGGRGVGYGGFGFHAAGFPSQKRSSPQSFFHYGGGGVLPFHQSSTAPSVPSLKYSEMSPESTLIEFISASASFAGVKKCSLRDLEFEIMKVCPNNIMPANAAAWYMGKKRFYDDFELLPMLLKNHEKRFAIKGNSVEFLDAYKPDVAKRKLQALVTQGVVAYFTHKIDEYGVYFFDPLYYENTEPFHANLCQETNYNGNTVKLLPKFFNMHKDKFVYQKISPYLVTISREPVEIKVNVTCVVVSMVDNQFGILQFKGEGGKTEKAMFSANSLYKDGYNFKGDPVKLPHMCFDGYRVPAKGDPSKESMWVAVLVWSGRKPSPKFCSTRDDLAFPGMSSHSLGGGTAAAAAHDVISNECMQIGEILEIQNNGAVASLRKDTDERAFIPGWSHQHVRSGTSFLVTSQGVELALKDLVAFYVDPKKKPRKGFKAVGCNVMVLKHGGKVEKNSKGSKQSVTDSGDSSDGLKKGKKKKRRDRKASTKSGASSVGHGDESDGAKLSRKAKAPAQEQKPRGVAYKELLLTAEIPEEDDNYDSDFDPPFIPPAIPDPDLDYDEYSDGEIPEDEIKELEKEGEAALDVEDLRKKMMEAKLEADKAKTEVVVVEQKKEATGGKEKKTTEDEVEKSKDVDGLGPKPEIEAEKKSSEK